MFPELSRNEQIRVAEMLEVHDWAEYDESHGDVATCDVGEHPGALMTKQQKDAIELEIMQRLCSEISQGDYIFEVWLEHESRQTPAAQISGQLDKIQALIQAAEYEKQYPNRARGITWEFYGTSEDKISHPFMKSWLANIMSQPHLQKTH